MEHPISALARSRNNSTNRMFTPLSDLQPGTVSDILVMVSRRWDNTTPSKQYFSTEYLLSDQAGHVIQCTALHKHTPRLALQLDEGDVYILKNILAIENRDNYRVCKNNDHALLFLPQTTITEINIGTEGFIRHPFEFINFELIESTDDKYLIDVVGYIHTVTKPTVASDHCEYLDCQLINERGTVLDIIIWGQFCRDFLIAQHNTPPNTPMIFAAMSVDQHNGRIYLGATMDTRIFSATDIVGCNRLNDALTRLKQHENSSL